VRILAFDTATPATTVALGDGHAVLELRDDPPPGQRPRHATRLLAMITDLLDRAGIDWAGVDRIGVGVGPGTFTGLRVGIATAKALAQAAETPVVAVSTLRSLALNARPAPADSQSPGAVAAVLDARRGEVFAAVWILPASGGLGESLLTPRAVDPEALATMLGGLNQSVLAVGDGAIAFRNVLERPGVRVPQDPSELHRVTATRHVEIALREPTTPPERLAPDYQRLPDAKPRVT
jgi:tRNA threonylcarbamoyladenosine biosynthesis protein TsaB